MNEPNCVPPFNAKRFQKEDNCKTKLQRIFPFRINDKSDSFIWLGYISKLVRSRAIVEFVHKYINLLSCLFVCLCFIVPLENFPLIWKRHHYRGRAANFDLCSALMAIEQWGLFYKRTTPTVTRASAYNALLRGPVTLTPTAERFAVEACFYCFVTIEWDINFVWRGLIYIGLAH